MYLAIIQRSSSRYGWWKRGRQRW